MRKQYMEKILDELIAKVVNVHFAEAICTERGEIMLRKESFSEGDIEEIKAALPERACTFYFSIDHLNMSVRMMIIKRGF